MVEENVVEENEGNVRIVPRAVASEALRKARFTSKVGKQQLAKKRLKAKTARQARKEHNR